MGRQSRKHQERHKLLRSEKPQKHSFSSLSHLGPRPGPPSLANVKGWSHLQDDRKWMPPYHQDGVEKVVLQSLWQLEVFLLSLPIAVLFLPLHLSLCLPLSLSFSFPPSLFSSLPPSLSSSLSLPPPLLSPPSLSLPLLPSLSTKFRQKHGPFERMGAKSSAVC